MGFQGFTEDEIFDDALNPGLSTEEIGHDIQDSVQEFDFDIHEEHEAAAFNHETLAPITAPSRAAEVLEFAKARSSLRFPFKLPDIVRDGVDLTEWPFMPPQLTAPMQAPLPLPSRAAHETEWPSMPSPIQSMFRSPFLPTEGPPMQSPLPSRPAHDTEWPTMQPLFPSRAAYNTKLWPPMQYSPTKEVQYYHTQPSSLVPACQQRAASPQLLYVRQFSHPSPGLGLQQDHTATSSIGLAPGNVARTTRPLPTFGPALDSSTVMTSERLLNSSFLAQRTVPDVEMMKLAQNVQKMELAHVRSQAQMDVTTPARFSTRHDLSSPVMTPPGNLDTSFTQKGIPGKSWEEPLWVDPPFASPSHANRSSQWWPNSSWLADNCNAHNHGIPACQPAINSAPAFERAINHVPAYEPSTRPAALWNHNSSMVPLVESPEPLRAVMPRMSLELKPKVDTEPKRSSKRVCKDSSPIQGSAPKRASRPRKTKDHQVPADPPICRCQMRGQMTDEQVAEQLLTKTLEEHQEMQERMPHLLEEECSNESM